MDRKRPVHMDHSLPAAVKMNASASAQVPPVCVEQHRKQPQLGSGMCHTKLQFSVITHSLRCKQKVAALTAMVMHGNKINMVKFHPPYTI